jgi:hypothetical protein
MTYAEGIEYLNGIDCVFFCRLVHVVSAVDFSIGALANKFHLFKFAQAIEG